MPCMKTLALALTPSALIIVVSTVTIITMMIRGKDFSKGRHQEIHVCVRLFSSLCIHMNVLGRTQFCNMHPSV